LDVLELLAAQPHALPLQEIARRLQRSPSELFRMLDVLVQRAISPGCRTRATRSPCVCLNWPTATRRSTGCSMSQCRICKRWRARRDRPTISRCTTMHGCRAVPGRAAGTDELLGAHRCALPFLDDRVSARVITAFQATARQDLLLRELGGSRS